MKMEMQYITKIGTTLLGQRKSSASKEVHSDKCYSKKQKRSKRNKWAYSIKKKPEKMNTDQGYQK